MCSDRGQVDAWKGECIVVSDTLEFSMVPGGGEAGWGGAVVKWKMRQGLGVCTAATPSTRHT